MPNVPIVIKIFYLVLLYFPNCIVLYDIEVFKKNDILFFCSDKKYCRIVQEYVSGHNSFGTVLNAARYRREQFFGEKKS